MSSLGPLIAEAGQGYLRGQQQLQERRQKERAFKLEEDRLAQTREFAEKEAKFRETQAAREEIERINTRLNDPKLRKQSTPAAWKAMEDKSHARISRLYRQYPELSDSALEDVPSTIEDPTAQVPVAGPPVPQERPRSPFADVRNVGGQAVLPEAPAPAGIDAQAEAPQPPPSQPLVPGPRDLRAPVPATAGQGVGLAAPPLPQFGEQPQQPQQQPQQQPAEQQGQQAPRDRFDLLVDRLIQRMNDPAAAPEDQEQAEAQLLQTITAIAQVDQAKAQTLFLRAQAAEVAPDAASRRAGVAEQIQASQDERLKFKPEELRLKGLEIKGKNRPRAPTIADQLAVMRLRHQMQQDALENRRKERDFQYGVGKDAAEFEQRERTEEGRKAERARAALIDVIKKSVFEIDKVTRQPVLIRGGLETFKTLLADAERWGSDVSVGDMNPGYDQEVWSAVNTPGFDANAAIATAKARGDTESAKEIRGAWEAAVQQGKMMAGRSTPPASSPATPPRTESKPSAKPAAKPKPRPNAAQALGGRPTPNPGLRLNLRKPGARSVFEPPRTPKVRSSEDRHPSIRAR